MSSLIVKLVEGGRSSRRRVIKQHARKYGVSYGTLLKTPAGKLVIYAKDPIPDYFSWLWKHKPAGRVIFVARYLNDFIIIICADEEIHLCTMKSPEQTTVLLESQEMAGLLLVYPEEVLSRNTFKEIAHRKSWSLSSPQIGKLPALKPVRVLVPAPLVALALPLIPGLVAFYLLNVPTVETAAEEIQYPFSEVERQLTNSPGRLTPMLRLDFNYLNLIEGIPGWTLSQVEYSTHGVLYTLENTQGSYQELRSFAHELNIGVRFSSTTAYLSKPLNLPVVFTHFEPSMLINQHQQIASLHDRIREWIPAAQLVLQQEQRTDSWVSQRTLIQFSGLFPDDLLTLAGLLEGMALKFEHGKYRINNGQLTGNILVTLYGATS